MLNQTRRTARARLAERLAPAAALQPTKPPKGWIRALREALGMSRVQLARRLGVTQQSADNLERSEAAGTIQLDKLRRAAEVLDCTLVYALVPNRPLEAMVKDRARAIAIAAIRRVDQTMTLEDQKVERESDEQLIEDYIRDHVRDRELWD
jgi:predicted DNA-binding mobile mystery protein A